MAELDMTANVWLLYAAATVALLALLWRLMPRFIGSTAGLILIASLTIILFSPAAVPGTQSLAPAWLVAAFEYALGRPASGEVALRPILYLLAAAYSLFVIYGLFRWYFPQKTTAETE